MCSCYGVGLRVYHDVCCFFQAQSKLQRRRQRRHKFCGAQEVISILVFVVMFNASVHACTLSCMHVCIHMHVCMCVFVYVYTIATHVIVFGCVSVMMCVCVCV